MRSMAGTSRESDDADTVADGPPAGPGRAHTDDTEETVSLLPLGPDPALHQATVTVSLAPVETKDTVLLRTSGRHQSETPAREPRPPALPPGSGDGRDGRDGDVPVVISDDPLSDSVGLSREDMRSPSRLLERERGAQASTPPREAMWQNELARYRHLITVVLGIVLFGVFTLPLMGGSSTIKTVVYVTMGFLAVTCIWHRVLLEKPERVRHSNVRITWLAAGVATCAAVAYFGVYSPAPVIMALEILLVGMTNDRPLIYGFYAISAGFIGAMGLLVGLEVMPDPGLIHAEYLDQQNRLVGLVMVESLLVAALWIGVSTRREIMTSFEELYQASQLVAQQRAMVREVRQELERAANVGGHGPLTGEVLGSYELGVVIGRGGMGEVYRAVHIESGELAAIKVLLSHAMQEPGSTARFAREIDVARSLAVPNIVRVLEVGGEDTVPYLAMEYLHGQDLARYLRRRGRLSPARVIKLVREVGAGIDAAGQAGIVHRDLKPHNLFLAEVSDKEKVWKILDFGVATLVSHSGTLTQGRVIGTPAYMAPEQARGKQVDHRADLYALCSIVYRALTGHPPFSGEDVPSLLYRVVHEMPRRPTRLADLHDDIDTVLAVGMAKDPDDRFASAAELADAILAALGGQLAERHPELAARAERLAERHPWR